MGFSRRYGGFRSETSEAVRIGRRILQWQVAPRSIWLSWIHHGDDSILKGHMRSQRIDHHRVSLNPKGLLCLRRSINYLHSAEEVR